MDEGTATEVRQAATVAAMQAAALLETTSNLLVRLGKIEGDAIKWLSLAERLEIFSETVRNAGFRIGGDLG